MRKKGKNEEWATRKMDMWIARDKDYSKLYMYTEEPDPTLWDEFTHPRYDGERIQLPFTMFDEIVFENSPVKVEMKMKFLVPKEGY